MSFFKARQHQEAMARPMREDLGQRPGFFASAADKSSYQSLKAEADRRFAEQQVAYAEQAERRLVNEMVDQREQLRRQIGLPTGAFNEQNNAVNLGLDRIVDLQNHGGAIGGVAAGIGASALGLGALHAYNQQQLEGQPTDPLSVAGRMTSNGLSGFAGVGVDPLAAARNRVAEAGGLVGSDRVFEAISNDYLDAEQVKANGSKAGDSKAAAKPPRDIENELQVAALVDARAQQLMSTGVVQTATGPRPLNSDEAIRFAQEDVAQQLRYGDSLVAPGAEAAAVPTGYGY